MDWGSVPRGIASLKQLPPPDILESSLPAGYVCLITDDGSDLTPTLADALAGRGWNVVVLSYSALSRKDEETGHTGEMSVPRVVMDEMSEVYLQKKLDEIAATFGPVGAVIHLNPRQNSSVEASIKGETHDGQEKLIVKHVFMLAKHLKETLNNAAEKGRSIFMSVIRLDGEFGLSKEADFDPISGGLFGLVKTLNLEWEPVFCRAVDLDPVYNAPESTKRIIAELYDPNRLISEVGYSQRGRLTLVVEPTSSKERN
jgi:NAD(P)-dependent dehydrogenase (short-subunit alcohol dehydrogenase family)